VVLAWWDHENELPPRVFLRRVRTHPWRAAQAGESICVWDLEILWDERLAYVATMLTPAGSGRAGYLERVHDREAEEGKSGAT
jgi:hypothetical protein